MREALIYLLLITLAMLLGSAAVFATYNFVLGQPRVPPEVAFGLGGIMVVVVTFVRVKQRGSSMHEIGLHADAGLLSYSAGGLIAGAGMLSLFFAICYLLGLVQMEHSAAASPQLRLMVVFFASVWLQSALEEFIFRGYLLQVLLRRGTAAAVLSTSLAFSLLHVLQGFNLMGLFNIFLFGVVAALMVCLTDSLWLAIGFHAGWNFFTLHVFGFPMYGAERLSLLRASPAGGLLTGGSYGPEGSALMLLILAAASGLLWSRMPRSLRKARD